MFKIIWIAVAIIVAIGWIAYGVWRLRERSEEKKRPKPTTEHLKQVRKSFDDYIQKMEKYEKPTYKRDQ